MENVQTLNDKMKHLQSRRRFLGKLSAGALGLVSGTILTSRDSSSGSRTALSDKSGNSSGLSRVSFATGQDRREMVYSVLKPFDKEVKAAIRGKRIIIKPNFVSTRHPVSATHVNSVRGVLDFLKPIYKKKVIIAESSTVGKTFDGYKNYGYLDLEREYDVELLDLNSRGTITEWILDKNHHPLPIRIIDSFLDPDNYFISVTRLKSHDTVVTTLSVKNMVMGSPLNDYKKSEKPKMHQGYKEINWNIFYLAQKIRPQIAVLEALEGMEGNGPVNGTGIEHGVALAGTDVVAVDRIGTELMGVDFSDVGYLTYMANAGIGEGNRSKIQIIGPDPADYVKKYRMHDTVEKQLEWKLTGG